MSLPSALFGFGAHTEFGQRDDLLRLTRQADADGLDVFSLSDHPYLGNRIDAYAAIGFVLGRTERLAGLANVTNLPSRPAQVLARTVASLASLSNGRVVLGMGAGGLWNRITDMGFSALTPGEAVDAFEEGITLIKRLCGTEGSVTYEGRFYRTHDLEPSPMPPPPVWTGSVGPRSLAVTGRVADGWIPGHAADWLSERYRESRPIIDAAADAAGRDPADIGTVYNLPGSITRKPLQRTRDENNRWVGGSTRQWVDELTEAVRDHRAAGFILFAPDGEAPDPYSLSLWAQEIAPAVRSAIGLPT